MQQPKRSRPAGSKARKRKRSRGFRTAERGGPEVRTRRTDGAAVVPHCRARPRPGFSPSLALTGSSFRRCSRPCVFVSLSALRRSRHAAVGRNAYCNSTFVGTTQGRTHACTPCCRATTLARALLAFRLARRKKKKKNAILYRRACVNYIGKPRARASENLIRILSKTNDKSLNMVRS